MAYRDISDSVTQLEELVSDAYDKLQRSKKCSGCIFLETTFHAAMKDGSLTPNRRVKDEIIRMVTLILQASQCKGIRLDDLRIPEVIRGNRSSLGNVLSIPAYCQTDNANIIESNTSSSQTDISSSYYEEVDQFRRWVAVSESSYMRRWLEQLFKISAIEKERENSVVNLQFAKTLLQMKDDEFDTYYKEYLKGTSPQDLRRKWMKVELADASTDCELDTKCNNSDADKTIIEEKPVVTGQQREPTAEELEELRDEYFSKMQKITTIFGQLEGAKKIIVLLANEAHEVESAEQNEISHLLRMINKYTVFFNGRRKSVETEEGAFNGTNQAKWRR